MLTTCFTCFSDLRETALETFSRLPTALHYRPGDLNDPNTDMRMLRPRLVVRLEHLQNILFIERLLLRHGNEDRAGILATSFELVSLTLSIWTHRERLTTVTDREWLVSLFGP